MKGNDWVAIAVLCFLGGFILIGLISAIIAEQRKEKRKHELKLKRLGTISDRQLIYNALMSSLRYLSPDEPTFRSSDGAVITAGQMVKMLENDNPAALAFLQDVAGAAVRVTQLKSRKK